MADAEQPNSLWNYQKTFYKTFSTSCCPRVYNNFKYIFYSISDVCNGSIHHRTLTPFINAAVLNLLVPPLVHLPVRVRLRK